MDGFTQAQETTMGQLTNEAPKSTRFTSKSEAVLEGKGLNFSHCTVGTETTSFSEDGDENDAMDEPFSTGVFRIDDLLSCADENDSLSVAAPQTGSLGDADTTEMFADQGLPREIVVLDEDALDTDYGTDDIHQRLRIAQALAKSYKAQIQSTEDMTDHLHEHLKQAQNYAEDVLADRDDLLREIATLQNDEQRRMDQYMFLKAAVACSVCYYLCGGSPVVLSFSAGIYLVFDAVNTLL